MTLVLWNAGLINGVHRHGEMGLRLALGETHRDLVFRLAVEALVIGVAGSIAGCMVGGHSCITCRKWESIWEMPWLSPG